MDAGRPVGQAGRGHVGEAPRAAALMHHAEADRAERARQWAGRSRDAPHPHRHTENHRHHRHRAEHPAQRDVGRDARGVERKARDVGPTQPGFFVRARGLTAIWWAFRVGVNRGARFAMASGPPRVAGWPRSGAATRRCLHERAFESSRTAPQGFSRELRRRAARPRQCSAEASDKTNSATGASKLWASSVMQKKVPRIVPCGVASRVQLVYSKLSPGLRTG